MTGRDEALKALNNNVHTALKELTIASNLYGPKSKEVIDARKKRASTAKALFEFCAEFKKRHLEMPSLSSLKRV